MMTSLIEQTTKLENLESLLETKKEEYKKYNSDITVSERNLYISQNNHLEKIKIYNNSLLSKLKIIKEEVIEIDEEIDDLLDENIVDSANENINEYLKEIENLNSNNQSYKSINELNHKINFININIANSNNQLIINKDNQETLINKNIDDFIMQIKTLKGEIENLETQLSSHNTHNKTNKSIEKKINTSKNNQFITNYINNRKNNNKTIDNLKIERDSLNENLIDIHDKYQTNLDILMKKKISFNEEFKKNRIIIERNIESTKEALEFYQDEIDTINNNLILLEKEGNPNLKALNIKNKDKIDGMLKNKEIQLLEINNELNNFNNEYVNNIENIGNEISNLKKQLEIDNNNISSKITVIENNIKSIKSNNMSQRLKDYNIKNITNISNDANIEEIENQIEIKSKSILVIKERIEDIQKVNTLELDDCNKKLIANKEELIQNKEILLKQKLEQENVVSDVNSKINNNHKFIKLEKSKINKFKENLLKKNKRKNDLYGDINKMEKNIDRNQKLIVSEKENIEKYKNTLYSRTQTNKINLLLEIGDLEKVISQTKSIIKNLSKN